MIVSFFNSSNLVIRTKS